MCRLPGKPAFGTGSTLARCRFPFTRVHAVIAVVLRVYGRGGETERGQHGFQVRTLGSVQVWPVPATAPYKWAVEVAKGHGHGGEWQVLPFNRQTVEPGGKAVLAQEQGQVGGRDVH